MTRELLPKFSYTKKDFVLDWFSGTGKGGQKRNKTQACLRLTHIPSGITVTAQTERDRSSNQRNAFEQIRPKLEAWIRSQIGETTYPRSNELVRTYHEVDNRVLDHASGERESFSRALDDPDAIDRLMRARASAERKGLRPRTSGRLSDPKEST